MNSHLLAGCIWGVVVCLDEAVQLALVDAAFARLVKRHQPLELSFVEPEEKEYQREGQSKAQF